MTLETLYPVSNATLELTHTIESLLELSGGEITPEIQKEMNDLAKLERITDMVNYFHRLDAQARAKQAEIAPIIDELEADLRFLESKRERAKQLIQQIVPPGPESAFCTESVNVFYSESTVCDVTDEKIVPIEYTKVITSVDKTAAKQALKEGKDVPGCQLKINYNLQIKHAGPRAQANKAARAKKKVAKTIDQTNNIGEV